MPSPGPLPYDEDLSDVFYGREVERNKLVTYIQNLRLTVLTAESASGKTSLLRAGLLPKLRDNRIIAWKEGKTGDNLPIFPLLLNQWILRASGSGELDFIRIFVSEADRYLDESIKQITGYGDKLGTEVAAEIDAIKIARKNLRSKAVELGLIKQAETCPKVEFLPLQDDWSLLKMRRQSMELLDVLYDSLGPIVLIFDQFEEILMDPVLGYQALYIVKQIFKIKKREVTQLLSLRNDKRHLLSPLEREKLIDPNRIIEIYPFKPNAANEVVKKMCQVAGLEWEEPDDLARLVAAFTQYSTGGGAALNVNMLGLQVVLYDLFKEYTRVTRQDLWGYCTGLDDGNQGEEVTEEQLLADWLGEPDPTSSDSTVKVSRLAELAPLSWIERCLNKAREEYTALQDGSRQIIPELVRPMVMRMADQLVTPAGFKRPVTILDFKEATYKRDLDKQGFTPAGNAINDNGENWDDKKIEDILFNTCWYALDQLTQNNILKKRGGDKVHGLNGDTEERSGSVASETKSASDNIYYELVHDQFGLPLKEWARKIESTPFAVLGWPYAITDKEFLWKRPTRLAHFIPDSPAGSRKLLDRVAWIGCALTEVEFSEIELKSCNFARSVFKKCTFNNVLFTDCTLEQALFEECTFSGCRFVDGVLNSLLFSKCSSITDCIFHGEKTSIEMNDSAIENCNLTNCTFIDGKLVSINISNSPLTDCTFRGNTEKSPLLMNGASIINCKLSGTITFANCLLNGAVIGVDSEGLRRISCENIVFNNGSVINGTELNGLSFEQGRLQMENVSAMGVIFTNIVQESKESRGAFRDVNLTGAVFLGCKLKHVDFRGPEKAREKAEAKMVVFRELSSEEKEKESIPTVLDDVTFHDIDMQAFDFVECRVQGLVEFQRCKLDGGSIEGAPGNDSSIIEGDIRFHDDNNMSAMAFTSLDFSNQVLEIHNSSANAVYFEDVTFGSKGKKDSATFINTPMASGMFHNCRLHNVKFSGTKENPVNLESLIIKKTAGEDHTDAGVTLGNCVFTRSLMNGLTIFNVDINGPVQFSHCRLSASRIGNHESLERADAENKMRISAEVTFDDCDLHALHLRQIDFAEDATCTVNRGSCDGAVFQRLDLSGKLKINNSSLLRAKFEEITSQGDGGVDIRTSDLYYAQFDARLLENDDRAGAGPVRLTKEQLKNARELAAGYKRIKEQDV